MSFCVSSFSQTNLLALRPRATSNPATPLLLRLFMGFPVLRRSKFWILLVGSLFTAAEAAAATDPLRVAPYHDAQAEHCDQIALTAISDPHARFDEAFECGDELFDTRFNSMDGVGANVGDQLRFTRVPRADLVATGEWASHIPMRSTGPNAEACTVCHIDPFEDGSGAAGMNAVRDPLHTGDLAQFIQRNTPHLFGAGALQRLAEEMTVDLATQVEEAREISCASAVSEVTVPLASKSISFGEATLRCDGSDDLAGLEGIDEDLVVKPFQWKGNTATLRQFNRDASHNELGMQAVEIVGYGVDGDSDGIVDELSVGDISALSIYVAAQPRPTTRLELHRHGLAPLSDTDITSIRSGSETFIEVGCADCHRPELILDGPTFSEPSQTAGYMDLTFPAGQDPVAEGVDPENPIAFDLTADQPDNQLGKAHFGAFKRTENGGARVSLYGDLKRHDMGPGLAENIDETGVGASVWLTKELWGVGSTAPYLHDGRATTLTEAILEHGGDAASSRDLAAALPETEFQNLIAFLDNLVLFKLEGEEPVVFEDRHRREKRDGQNRDRRDGGRRR